MEDALEICPWVASRVVCFIFTSAEAADSMEKEKEYGLMMADFDHDKEQVHFQYILYIYHVD